MKIAIAQINTRIGDFAANRRKILSSVDEGRAGGADIVVFPELAVTGYPPRDLLYDAAFVAAAVETTQAIAKETASGPAVILGTVSPADQHTLGHPGLYNIAAILMRGTVATMRAKRLLPAYDVFYEPRWFVPGGPQDPVEIAGHKVGVLVCEDLWEEWHSIRPTADLVQKGAELLIALSASPYRRLVHEQRLHHARRPRVPVIYVNCVGANDEIIFDGRSFAVDARGSVLERLPHCEEAVRIVDLARQAAFKEVATPWEEEHFEALCLGLRDYVHKNALPHAFLGLSGGIDSALVACIAKEALGARNVTAVSMPSRYSDPRSTETALELSRTLGICCDVVPIHELHQTAEKSLACLIPDVPGGATAENMQARLRTLILMAYVNRRGGLLLNTSNKTELAVGYGTLYGDLAGAIGVIADLIKPEVYALSRWYNRRGPVIPEFTLERTASAELRENQVDPFDYPRFAPLVEALIQGTAIPEYASEEEIARTRAMIKAAEHKRSQFGIALKVSEKAFGTGRMVPVTRA